MQAQWLTALTGSGPIGEMITNPGRDRRLIKIDPDPKWEPKWALCGPLFCNINHKSRGNPSL